MGSDETQPRLDFFRATPSDLIAEPPLASSLQNFETCLFLVGLKRYPSAVVSCATALESALKAKLEIGPDEWTTLEKLLTDIRSRFEPLRAFDNEKLVKFRRKRNDLVHYGFSPRDDEECATLLLETGLPFLSLCYRVLFDFFLDWQEVRPGITEFSSLTADEMAKAGLDLEVAEQIRFVKDIYSVAKRTETIEATHCFSSLSHFIRWHLKETAKTETKIDVFDSADSTGLRYEYEQKTKRDLDKLFGFTSVFNCPICHGVDCLVAELIESELPDRQIVTDRCACVQCGFVVGKGAPYISPILLADQIANNRQKILNLFSPDGS